MRFKETRSFLLPEGRQDFIDSQGAMTKHKPLVEAPRLGRQVNVGTGQTDHDMY